MTKGRSRGLSDLSKPTLKLPPQTNGYAFPSLSAHDDHDHHESSHDHHPHRGASAGLAEITSGLLIAVPFLIASLNNPVALARHHKVHNKLELAEEAIEEVAMSAVPVPDSLLNLLGTCLLTAGTLLLVGLWGRYRQTAPSSRKRKVTLTSATQPSISSQKTQGQSPIKSLLKRIACVALPYLATVEIGGVRTSILLLAAAASGLFNTPSSAAANGFLARAKNLIASHKGFCALFGLCIMRDLYWHVEGTEYSGTIRGYAALLKALLLLQPPFPQSTAAVGAFTGGKGPMTPTTPTVPASPRSPGPRLGGRKADASILIASPEETKLSLFAGCATAGLAGLIAFFISPVHLLNMTNITLFAGSIISAAAVYTVARPSSLQTSTKLGLGVALALTAVFGLVVEQSTVVSHATNILLPSAAFALAFADDKHHHTHLHSHGKKDGHDHGHGHGHHHHHHHDGKTSKFTQFLLSQLKDYPVMHEIISQKESRRIVYFMLINLGFMFVQTFYALLSGSLGLLSDSIHMFFDCMGLLAGLIASVMSRWKPNAKYPYGYGKVETLSGLGNGIFLMIISVEIIWESIERFMEGAQLKHLSELMLVSVGGLAVNLIGLFFIGHAHHGHDHGHDHHHHDNENMIGIYLHILADTMGSVAVIISTILTAYTGWAGWDPIASAIIAVLIIGASIPLVSGSAQRLLLSLPIDVEYQLRDALQELLSVRGVNGYAVPRFWLDDASQKHDHDHDHDHGHDHSHDHGHDEKHDHAHTHHNHASHDHSHSHSNGHSHNHAHSHGHTEAHTHSHANGHAHKHDHAHDHTHDQSLAPAHDHSHGHAHAHAHEHEHEHAHAPPQILGVIHVIASRGADLEDVRARATAFFAARGMHLVIQVDREGAGRCWCGGDKTWSAHNRTSSIVPGLG